MPLDVLVETVLFYKASPQKISTLKKLFEVSDEAWEQGITALEARLKNGALRLVKTEEEVQLVTAPELSEFVEAMRKDEISGDIGKGWSRDTSHSALSRDLSLVQKLMLFEV